MSKRRIEIPASDYQPTKAEMNEPIMIDRGGLSVDEATSRVVAARCGPGGGCGGQRRGLAEAPPAGGARITEQGNTHRCLIDRANTPEP